MRLRLHFKAVRAVGVKFQRDLWQLFNHMDFFGLQMTFTGAAVVKRDSFLVFLLERNGQSPLIFEIRLASMSYT
ncbi:hypothetical protein A167_01697 [Alcanivorax sp. S71-1-4]|nr:hypothetical protein A167_01697 [Alcanivorax sp. S71-1-4]